MSSFKKLVICLMAILFIGSTVQQEDSSVYESVAEQLAEYKNKLYDSQQQIQKFISDKTQASQMYEDVTKMSSSLQQQVSDLQGQLTNSAGELAVSDETIKELKAQINAQKANDFEALYNQAQSKLEQKDYIIQGLQGQVEQLTNQLGIFEQYTKYWLPIWSHKYYFLAEGSGKRAYNYVVPMYNDVHTQYVRPSLERASSSSKQFVTSARQSIKPHYDKVYEQTLPYHEPVQQYIGKGKELYNSAYQYGNQVYQHPTTQKYFDHGRNVFQQSKDQLLVFKADMDKFAEIRAQKLGKDFPELEPFINKEVVSALVTFFFTFPIAIFSYIGFRYAFIKRKQPVQKRSSSKKNKKQQSQSQ